MVRFWVPTTKLKLGGFSGVEFKERNPRHVLFMHIYDGEQMNFIRNAPPMVGNLNLNDLEQASFVHGPVRRQERVTWVTQVGEMCKRFDEGFRFPLSRILHGAAQRVYIVWQLTGTDHSDLLNHGTRPH
jgi:hypothetical protein